MATTGVGFRWLDILEKEFDKACVELDTSLLDLESEETDTVFGARQKIATLSSCFAQLTHKALTIFQNSAKLEAELVDMRAELVQARAACAGGMQDSGDAAGNVTDVARARSEAAQLARENAALRETVLALHSELFGARLATKYLDKELAGRIQQLQLLGRDMRAELRDSLWAQVEAEILLQRHKTLVRVCRGLSPRPSRPPQAPGGRDTRSRPRTVRVRRSPHLGLGISVTGGREHGVPILISELEAGGPAALTGELYVGDAILAINDVDLTQACHKEAVQALQSVKGDCALCVQFIATDDDDDRLSEDNYRFPLYPEDGEVFSGEPDGSGATPTAPRTPDYNRRESDVGSGSECESPRYGDPYLTTASANAAPAAPPAAPYPDYNSINNNLSILDMDDDTIKIETRLEVVQLESPQGSPAVGRRLRGAYRGLPDDSSADSPHSTPVHARKAPAKKKRKPLDWRSKGAYRPVANDALSSDEPPVTDALQDYLPADMICHATTVQEAPLVPLPPPQEVPIPPLILQSLDKNKPNGDDKILTRKETKGFRIGSARRVTEQHASLTNGDVEKSKFPVCLLTGEGDPDFGTPV
ncbi:Golgi-associated PDZ and coiled-coil motif-containing protein-like isoform X2 [Hyposmocoma kahamanoa]|uniref:Golgi-associated PDZ and coiled-coil motif-containing protein-like isoform X2 n=1 Tax=Hyposmocoma kahamanoa TaxID=1477025 RepID=UPI000E6D5C9A|nr:Golgi-associated PDZ and coiled-coil motif-containing protein-like isoform X2 [Hyposmocoma kahamanoa]